MKKIKNSIQLKFMLSLLAAAFLTISCTPEEGGQVDTALEVRMEVENSPIYRMAVEFRNTSNDPNVSAEQRAQLTGLSDMIFNDLEILIRSKTVQRDAVEGGCIPPGYCYDDYEICVEWAVLWDNLLMQCNGGPYPPSNCDQVRADYLANLDEIEETYIKCAEEREKCIKLYCPGSGGGGQY